MYKVALFGAGRMGQIHLANLCNMPEISLRYIYDPAFADGPCPEHTDARYVNTIDEILGDKSIDACIIATPSTMHADLIIACAHAGKNVFCEKPVSFDVDVLMSVKNAVEKANVKLQIGFNRRFDPSLRLIKNDVARGVVGTLHLLKIINRDPVRPRIDFVKDSGGLFFDFNVHDFDMVRFMTGDEVASVYAVGNALVDPQLQKYNDIDTAIITAEMKSGALVSIDSSRETGYGYDQQLEVFGERGMLALTNQNKTTVAVRNSQGHMHDTIYANFQERYLESYRLELEEFFKKLDDTTCSPNLDDTMAAIKIARAAFRSHQENRPVFLTE